MVEQYQRENPGGSSELNSSMRQDKYALAPRRTKSKHNAFSDETVLTRSRRPGSAWNWTYTDEGER
ncbi:MAG: hypothetical protein M3Q07_25785 [Pseudobdellovibrionaceae bacterium]|nr:hypothetical protein [Pseudobdellovibrionaceae bacterium]